MSSFDDVDFNKWCKTWPYKKSNVNKLVSNYELINDNAYLTVEDDLSKQPLVRQYHLENHTVYRVENNYFVPCDYSVFAPVPYDWLPVIDNNNNIIWYKECFFKKN